jgi:hypothetical protein
MHYASYAIKNWKERSKECVGIYARKREGKEGGRRKDKELARRDVRDNCALCLRAQRMTTFSATVVVKPTCLDDESVYCLDCFCTVTKPGWRHLGVRAAVLPRPVVFPQH